MKFMLTLLIFFSLASGKSIEIFSSSAPSKYENFTQKVAHHKSLELDQYFGTYEGKIKIHLFNDHQTFREECGVGREVLGLMSASQRAIYLKTPKLTGVNLDQYKKLIHHEMIHFYHNQKMSINLFPDWFTEGIAVFLSGSYQTSEKIHLSNLILNKNLPSIKKLTRIDVSYRNRASSEYILAASMIEFLVTTYGEPVLQEIFQEMEKSKNFSKALATVTNLDIDLLNFYWKQFLKERYSSYFLLDIQYIFWLFLPFIFIFSLIVKLIQNQFIITKWNYEIFEQQINHIFIDPLPMDKPTDSSGIISGDEPFQHSRRLGNGKRNFHSI